jgi:hypothetical protein
MFRHLKPRHARGFLCLCASADTEPGGKPFCFLVGVMDGHDAPFAPVRYDKSPARLAPHNRAGRGRLPRGSFLNLFCSTALRSLRVFVIRGFEAVRTVLA